MRDAGSGDRLARGQVRASFLVSEEKITEDKWKKAFDDFNPEEFKKTGMPKVAGEKKETVRSRR